MERVLQNTSFLHSLAAAGNVLPADSAPPSLLPHSFCTSNAAACADMIGLAAGSGSAAGAGHGHGLLDDYTAARRAIQGVHGASSAQTRIAPGAAMSVTAALGTFWSGRTNLDSIVFERDCGGCPFVGGKPAPPLLRGRIAAHEGVAEPHGPPSLAYRSAALATASPFGGPENSVGAQACVRGCMNAPTHDTYAACYATCTGGAPGSTCQRGCMGACVASGRASDACSQQCASLCSHQSIDRATSSLPVPLSW
jgi:hypothetical protein